MRKMKLTSYIAGILVSSMAFFSSCTTPADYCEKMMAKCSNLESNVGTLAKEIANKDYAKVQEVYDDNLKEIDKTIEEIQSMGDFQEGGYLQSAALSYAQAYKEIYENEFATAIRIMKKENKTYADGDTIAFMIDDVSKKSQDAKNDLLRNFTKFVKEHGLIVAD